MGKNKYFTLLIFVIMVLFIYSFCFSLDDPNYTGGKIFDDIDPKLYTPTKRILKAEKIWSRNLSSK